MFRAHEMLLWAERWLHGDEARGSATFPLDSQEKP